MNSIMEQLSTWQRTDVDQATKTLQSVLGEKYAIRQMIGCGGMGYIFLATHKQLRSAVAIKVLQEVFNRDQIMVARFQQEARAAAQLSHPNIITIYDIGQAGEYNYFIMRHIEGKDLHSLLQQQGRLTVERTVALGIQVSEALSYAHNKGVIHRDIKPANILLDPEGNAVVTDFGIARSFSTTQLTLQGSIIGSPHYMSPEQARGDTVDKRCDQYSLGAVLYHCLCGRHPFEGTDGLGLIYKHIYDNPEPLERFCSDCDPRILEIVRRMMEKDPNRRFPDAGEVSAALREVLRSSASPSTPVPCPPTVFSAVPSLSPEKETLFAAGIDSDSFSAPDQRTRELHPMAVATEYTGMEETHLPAAGAMTAQASADPKATSLVPEDGEIFPEKRTTYDTPPPDLIWREHSEDLTALREMPADVAVGERPQLFPPRPWIRPVLLSLTGAAAIFLTAGIAWVMWQGRVPEGGTSTDVPITVDKESAAVTGSDSDKPGAGTTMPVMQTVSGSVPISAEEGKKWLAKAEEAILRQRWTSPEGDCALFYYTELSKIEAYRPQAAKGMQDLAQKALEEGRKAQAEGATPQARAYLQQALLLNPELQSAGQALQALQAPPPSTLPPVPAEKAAVVPATVRTPSGDNQPVSGVSPPPEKEKKALSSSRGDAAKVVDSGRIYSPQDVDEPPTLVDDAEPVYPEEARKRGLEDTILVLALVSETGEVTEARALKHTSKDPALEIAALEAARRCRFQPATLKDQPVKCWHTLKIQFRLNKSNP